MYENKSLIWVIFSANPAGISRPNFMHSNSSCWISIEIFIKSFMKGRRIGLVNTPEAIAERTYPLLWAYNQTSRSIYTSQARNGGQSTGSPSNGVPYKGLYGIPVYCVFLSFVSMKFQPISARLAEIGWNFIETQRKEHTRLQVSLFQFISRYSPEFRVLILYHCNPIQTLRGFLWTKESCLWIRVFPVWNWQDLLWLATVIAVGFPRQSRTKAESSGFYILPKNLDLQPFLPNSWNSMNRITLGHVSTDVFVVILWRFDRSGGIYRTAAIRKQQGQLYVEALLSFVIKS